MLKIVDNGDRITLTVEQRILVCRSITNEVSRLVAYKNNLFVKQGTLFNDQIKSTQELIDELTKISQIINSAGVKTVNEND